LKHVLVLAFDPFDFAQGKLRGEPPLFL